jgi:hypothetical protein
MTKLQHNLSFALVMMLLFIGQNLLLQPVPWPGHPALGAPLSYEFTIGFASWLELWFGVESWSVVNVDGIWLCVEILLAGLLTRMLSKINCGIRGY